MSISYFVVRCFTDAGAVPKVYKKTTCDLWNEVDLKFGVFHNRGFISNFCNFYLLLSGSTRVLGKRSFNCPGFFCVFHLANHENHIQYLFTKPYKNLFKQNTKDSQSPFD